jgi:DNA gyrase subunit B
MDEYLIGAGVEAMRLETREGARFGDDLRQMVDHARRMRALMAYVPRRYDPAIVEALAIGGALAPDMNPEAKAEAVAHVAGWLDASDPDARWTGRVAAEGGYHLERLWRGVTDHHIVEAAFLGSAEARKLHTLSQEQADSYAAPSRLVSVKQAAAEEGDDAPADPKGTPVNRPSELLDAIFAAGRKGLSVQRYKGLGEMNAEQLWETTLDPDVRSLLQVEIAQADVADEIFTRLMGDVVEPRREFIQENALSVANLDV